MRKYRSWLMGLGIGLILGATMLQVILMAKDQSVMVAEQSITREQLDEEAKKSGLVLLTAEQLDTRVNEAVATALEEDSAKNSNNDTSNGSNEQSTPIDDSKGALKPPPQKTDTENSTSSSGSAEEQREVTLYIAYKMTLTEVADKLQDLGVIEDKDDFVVKAWAISKKLSVGTSIFKTNSTYQQIMDELIREKTD